MAKSLQRLRALIYKETVQILRDRRTLILFFALPLIELFLFAYAVSLTVTHLPTAWSTRAWTRAAGISSRRWLIQATSMSRSCSRTNSR